MRLRRLASLALRARLGILSAVDPARSFFVASAGERLHLLRGDTLEIAHSWRLPTTLRGWSAASPAGPVALLSGPDTVSMLEPDGTPRWVTRHTPWSDARESGCTWFDEAGSAFAVIPDAQSEFCLVVHLDAHSGSVLAQQRIAGEPAGITPLPQRGWVGLSEGEGQDAARAWWIRLAANGRLDVRDAGWHDEILTDCDPIGARILTTPHSGRGPLRVRAFPDLSPLRLLEATTDGCFWSETACFVGEHIVGQLLGDGEDRLVVVDSQGTIMTFDTGPGFVPGDGYLVGAANGTWLTAGRSEIARWSLSE
ncbi:MAG TPA: hypothetical protein VGR46_01995 [Candidatus Limnocylindria bacterium]|nr:hypothetical protein [Candidatus Limnocylindria bacterium]HEV8654037.1 hypothetical protein [Candidatus Limnocylindria bacterium]